MNLDPIDVQRHATALGFEANSLEKALRLLALLEALRSHPYLHQRIALKGGTALNLFLFNLPRLSVDIDLNYIGTSNREAMLSERPKMEEAIHAVCAREGLAVKKMPHEHAGGKWRLSYANTAGGSGTLELDVNFMLRVPLWPITLSDSRQLGNVMAKQIPIVDRHELAAGKLAALCARNASRDIFDARELLQQSELPLDRAQLRLAFVVYGGLNRKDWRTVHVEAIVADETDIARELIPMLRRGLAPAKSDTAAWTTALINDCRDLMSVVLPLEANEFEFIDRLNSKGDIQPQLITSDPKLQKVIADHPGLQWKALNVRSSTMGTSKREDDAST